MSKGARTRIGVIGHVEHITLGRVPSVPRPGEIAHLEDPIRFPGGGGGVAFFQLAKSDVELHLFTAIGNDDAARFVETQLRQTQAHLHLARREEPHTRDVVMIDPKGDRTIVVVGEPLHPRATDPLPWERLSELDAVYFTAQDPDLLSLAREATLLLATARRRPSIILSGVRCDVVIGSRSDTRESSTLADYPVRPSALVMTEGKHGGSVETEHGIARFAAPSRAAISGGSYGAGDSFAGALTYFVASGLSVLDAASRATQYGAAVLEGLDPLQSQRTL